MNTDKLIRKKGSGHKVEYIELFFDLVFVLAIIMISHNLVYHFDAVGIFQTIFLLLAVWWVWIFTSWATNWLNPRELIVRWIVIFTMLGGLLMTVSIPYAFTKSAALFATSYVVIQLGRTLFMTWAFKHRKIYHSNFTKISIWFAFSGIFWISGIFLEDIRIILWVTALVIDYIAPMLNFRVPILGAASSKDWDVSGEHMAERCALFIMIAIGETILVLGRTFTTLDWVFINVYTFILLFFGIVALWLIYFNVGVDRGARHIAQSDDPGGIGRLSYTYIHILIILGVIFSAAAFEIALLHPVDYIKKIYLIAILGGPIMYVIGNLFFKRVAYGWYPQSHLIGLGIYLLIILSLSYFTSIISVTNAAIFTLIVIALSESFAVRYLPKEKRYKTD